jgi:hypothetical protein
MNIHRRYIMMKCVKIITVALIAALFGCHSSPTSPSDENLIFLGFPGVGTPHGIFPSGTFSGAVTATYTSDHSWFVAANTRGDTTTANELEIAYPSTSNSISSNISVSSPPGVTSMAFGSSLFFPLSVPPAVGTYTQASDSTCGGFMITGTTTTSTFSYKVSNATNCDGTPSDSAAGSYSLKITSVDTLYKYSNGVVSLVGYFVHGTLNATMPGQSIAISGEAITPGTVTIQTSF